MCFQDRLLPSSPHLHLELPSPGLSPTSQRCLCTRCRVALESEDERSQA